MQNSSPTDGSRSDLDPDLAETVAYCAIERLQRRYGDAVTRQAWDEVAACFDPEATVTVDLIDRSPLRRRHQRGVRNSPAVTIPAVADQEPIRNRSGTDQEPIFPPPILRITTVAGRGRPSGS
ncbi:MAG: nuclear transport factor 2 family protein [Microthrixaceae bacterium]|nr:nuclear transport factor 2 family protein [Microthrixaceae bacterium]